MAMQNARTRRRAAAGFTLMELMVVVGIVAILAGLVSTAMVRMMRQAANSRTDNQIAQIYAAIMEYRHDFGKWPVPDGDIPQEYRDRDDRRGIWKLKYCSSNMKKVAGDNSKVVEFLIKTKSGGAGRPKRDILDLHGFSGVDVGRDDRVQSGNDNTSATYSEFHDAWELSKPDDDGQTHGNVPLLVWKQRQYYCSECKRYSTSDRCKNKDCSYYKDNNAYRKLPSSSVREVAKPFYIMFDFSNDRVLVQRNPE